jgi:hypothetical protein
VQIPNSFLCNNKQPPKVSNHLPFHLYLPLISSNPILRLRPRPRTNSRLLHRHRLLANLRYPPLPLFRNRRLVLNLKNLRLRMTVFPLVPVSKNLRLRRMMPLLDPSLSIHLLRRSLKKTLMKTLMRTVMKSPPRKRHKNQRFLPRLLRRHNRL